MAYLDLNATVANQRASVSPTRRDDQALSGLERLTVELSLRDGMNSVRIPTRMDRLLALAFGLRRALPLADPRLEALRRYAVLYRLRGDALLVDKETLAEEAGLDRAKIINIRQLIDRSLSARRFWGWMTARTILSFAAIAAIGAADLWLGRQIDSPIIALVIIGASIVTLAPFFAKSGQSHKDHQHYG